MKHIHQHRAVLVALLTLVHPARAGNDTGEPAKGFLNWFTRPYRARTVPEVSLTNSSRLESLIRAGNLYLSARDVVALAIENNLDVEIQRYGPLLAKEVLKRAQAGGALRSVGLGVAQGPQSVSLQGVTVNLGGSVASTAGNGVSSGGGIVTQLGPSIPSLDPTFSLVANFQHTTSPQSNTILTGTTEFIQDSRLGQAQYQQNFSFGMSAQLTYSSQHIQGQQPVVQLNPYNSGLLDFQVTQNLLQGFGTAVNTRNIRVQKNNLKVTDLQFKQQVITTVSAALNLYWDLVAFNQDLRARKRELEAAQQLLQNNKEQVADRDRSPKSKSRARSRRFTPASRIWCISQTNLLQQETMLKNALSRNGVARRDAGRRARDPAGSHRNSGAGRDPGRSTTWWVRRWTSAWKSRRAGSTSTATS